MTSVRDILHGVIEHNDVIICDGVPIKRKHLNDKSLKELKVKIGNKTNTLYITTKDLKKVFNYIEENDMKCYKITSISMKYTMLYFEDETDAMAIKLAFDTI